MQPLDLLKVKLQVSSKPPTHPFSPHLRLARSTILSSFKDIIKLDGPQGLYRGLTTNLVGNAASWGLYFLWYSMIKDRMARDSEGVQNIKLSASQHLLASASSGVITAIITNPLWVVKTRMFTTRSNSQGAYKNLFDGLFRISKEEGVRGLWKGTVLALIGVSNGAIQFMTYEELKRWRRDKIQKHSDHHSPINLPAENLPLSNLEYIVLSGASKLVSIGLTYPYQVVRSRLQNQFVIEPHPKNSTLPGREARNTTKRPTTTFAVETGVHYRSIAHCISHTYRSEGLRAFYRGLGTNAIRILPGTCVTFVVYENLSNWFKHLALQKST